MASKDGMLFKFFEKWKQKRLNKFAKKMIKDNPQLEKDLQKMADTAKDILAGKFALINPATTSAEGLWLATIKCIPAALAICDSLVIDSLTSFVDDTNIKSANSSIIMTINGSNNSDDELNSLVV